MTPDLFPATDIAVVSLWQPWASLLFADLPSGERAKVHETRSWAAPRRTWGEQLAIQAAKRKVDIFDLDPALNSLCEQLWGPGWAAKLPLGQVLGTGVLDRCWQMPAARPAHAWDELCGDWSPGRFAWRLADARALPTPIPVIGRQGVWRIPRTKLGVA